MWARTCMNACVRAGALARACTCARVVLLIQQAKCRHIIICGLPVPIFFHIISQTARFSGEKLLNIKCVSWFSIQLQSKTCLILNRIQRFIVTNLKTSLCKIPVIFVIFQSNSNFLDRFLKTWNIKFYQNPSSGRRVVRCGQTVIRDEANRRFSQFCERA